MSTHLLGLGAGRTLETLGSGYPDVARLEAVSEMWALPSAPFSISGMLIGSGSTSSANATWFAANCPVAYPFVVNESVTVAQIGWFNGSAAGGNADIGIYDSSWARIVSSGSTACVTNTVPQFVDITDTTLPRGNYYLVLAMDNVTANRYLGYSSISSAPILNLCGVQDSATTAFPLPDPLTNMAGAATVTDPPLVFISLRSLV